MHIGASLSSWGGIARDASSTNQIINAVNSMASPQERERTSETLTTATRLGSAPCLSSAAHVRGRR